MPANKETNAATSATGWFVGIIVALALLAIGYLVVASHPPQAAQPKSTAFVKLLTPGGHGSGVHIGNGYIITAAHVADDFKDMTLKGSDGRSQTATLLWQNVKYDVALMRASKPDELASVALDCSPNFLGQSVIAEGNPSDLEFVRAYGKVIGGVRPNAPNWLEAVPVNMAIVPGMSGGAVLNDDGKVVGISVGVMATPYGMAALGYIVPATTICMLLDRT